MVSALTRLCLISCLVSCTAQTWELLILVIWVWTHPNLCQKNRAGNLRFLSCLSGGVETFCLFLNPTHKKSQNGPTFCDFPSPLFGCLQNANEKENQNVPTLSVSQKILNVMKSRSNHFLTTPDKNLKSSFVCHKKTVCVVRSTWSQHFGGLWESLWYFHFMKSHHMTPETHVGTGIGTKVRSHTKRDTLKASNTALIPRDKPYCSILPTTGGFTLQNRMT